MSVTSYKLKSGKKKWKADFWLEFPDRPPKRVIKAGIPTKEMALQFENKAKIAAFEGTYFERKKKNTVTAKQIWDSYMVVAKRDRKDWASTLSRSKHILKHLKEKQAATPRYSDIDEYRQLRSEDRSRRGTAPSIGTINREVALLRQMLNHGVKYGLLATNSIQGVKMVPENNVREVVLSPEDFKRLYESADEYLRPIMVIAFETGMRKSEILNLRWDQVDFPNRAIRLGGKDTKTSAARVAAMSDRVILTLEALPRSLSGYVFVNPKTNRPWNQIKKTFERARHKAGLDHIWFHDLRRSFVTNWRRNGVPESVIMRMSGHKTREVFARYNIISEDDLHSAVAFIEQHRKVASKNDNEHHGKDLERFANSEA